MRSSQERLAALTNLAVALEECLKVSHRLDHGLRTHPSREALYGSLDRKIDALQARTEAQLALLKAEEREQAQEAEAASA